jgi:periplasmic divalent cation tolerance protein
MQFIINLMRIVFVTCPQGQGSGLLRQLIEERLVAGGNIIAPVRSIYRWKGQVRDEPEEILLMETSEDQVGAMMARLQALHPYEVPKILTFEPREGPVAYLDWVEKETESC